MINAKQQYRDAGIDSLRALTMFIMIFVNDFWKVHDVPHWLEHATRGEDFMGLSDVVYPCFLFVVGMSIPFAIEQRFRKGLSDVSTVGHILSRTFALLIMGAFITNSEARLSPDVSYKIGVYWLLMVAAFICIWNQYPKTDNPNLKKGYAVLKTVGVLLLLFLAISFRNPNGGVFGASWGILGSIGWTYLLCALIYLFTRDRLKYLIPVWIVFVIICMAGSRMNEAMGGEAILSLPRPNFYNELLGVLHCGNGALPAFTTGGMILSILSAKYVQSSAKKKIIFVTLTVAILLLAGYISRRYWILSKLSATPTWIFYVSAIATGFYGLLYGLSKTGKDAWLNIIKPAGTATLTCYSMPYVAYALADLTGIILPDRFTHGFMGIVNCLCFALVIIGATWLLGRMHIKLKI